jgi:hypothetical protein
VDYWRPLSVQIQKSHGSAAPVCVARDLGRTLDVVLVTAASGLLQSGFPPAAGWQVHPDGILSWPAAFSRLSSPFTRHAGPLCASGLRMACIAA